MSSDKITQIKDFGDLKIYPYKDQDYEKLKNDCLAKGVLFEDPHFPAAEKSLYNSADNRLPFNVKWKRPSEIVDKPLFIDGALSADDLGIFFCEFILKFIINHYYQIKANWEIVGL